MELSAEDLRAKIRSIPDHPSPGVVFKDMTPVLANRHLFEAATEMLARPFRGAVDKVVGIEARGFILGAPVAQHLGAGFVPIRKKGKLPGAVHSESYALEYGTGVLEIHRDALLPGERVLIVDDVLATGGTAAAAIKLVRRSGSTFVGFAVLMDLGFADARERVNGAGLYAVLQA